MAYAFDIIAPFVANDVAYFIFSVGLSFLITSKSSGRNNNTMSLRLPPAEFNTTSEKAFHTNVRAALDSCISSLDSCVFFLVLVII